MVKSPFDLIHQNQHVDSRIIAALERISQAFRVLLWNEGKKLSLSPIQIQLLVFLKFHDKEMRKISYLAAEFNMTKATISDSIKTLESKKLVRKEYRVQDNRSHIVCLTAKGEEIAKHAALFTEELQAPLQGLSADDRKNLLTSLMNIIQYLNQSGIITIQRMCKTCAHFSEAPGKNHYFCNLLNQKLFDASLRFDCPEHKAA